MRSSQYALEPTLVGLCWIPVLYQIFKRRDSCHYELVQLLFLGGSQCMGNHTDHAANIHWLAQLMDATVL